LPELKVTE